VLSHSSPLLTSVSPWSRATSSCACTALGAILFGLQGAPCSPESYQTRTFDDSPGEGPLVPANFDRNYVTSPSASARTAGRRARRGPKGRGCSTRPWPRATAGARTRGSAAPGCPPGSGTRRARFVAPALPQDGADGGGLSDGAPSVMGGTRDGEPHRSPGPLVSWLGASPLQPMRLILPHLETPWADGVMGAVEPTFAPPRVASAGARRATGREPAPRAEALAGQARRFLACGGSGWRHVGHLSSG